MRTWNDFINVPLSERIPYNETGNMLARSRKEPGAPPQLVPYRKSGHMVRANNVEILTLAERASFAYWLTGEEKYARFAADIFWPWLLGTWYMQPPLDPNRDSGGPGGYAPRGIMGYYDYEQIHDDLMLHAATIYDFLHGYLLRNPDPHIKNVLKQDPVDVAETVFKRFIDIGFVRGGRSGNWNVNGWNMLMRGILVLRSDQAFPDGRGREFYLKHFTHISTDHHEALPDILKQYDPITGLWPESPGYALGTINILLDVAIPIQRAGTDIIGTNQILQKAALAVFPWMDARGNTVVFGDTRGGPGSFQVFERLLTYYTKIGDGRSASLAASAITRGIKNGQYARGEAGWEALCLNVPLQPSSADIPSARIAYSAAHRHLVMKNGDSEQHGLMATLYGGMKGQHLSPNGLALQLYGFGWALAPDASGYESYWSKDIDYHQSVTGSNTIVPGYAEGPIVIEACEPAPAAGQFVNSREVSPNFAFADVSAGEKRRLVSIVRTSPTTGYYLDIFRSRQTTNDYIHHNLGEICELFDNQGRPLESSPLTSVSPAHHPGYRFFLNPRNVNRTESFSARWTIKRTNPSIHMHLWMPSGTPRELVCVAAPHTNINPAVSPLGVNIAPESTPTLIVRQNGVDGWENPFVAVFEPYESDRRSVQSVDMVGREENFTAIVVKSAADAGQTELLLHATDWRTYTPRRGTAFQGVFAAISRNSQGLRELYLGRGTLVTDEGYSIHATKPTSASLRVESDGIVYSSDGPATLTVPATTHAPSSSRRRLLLKNAGRIEEVPSQHHSGSNTITVDLPICDCSTLIFSDSQPAL